MATLTYTSAYDYQRILAPAIGFLGAAACVVFPTFGAAYGTAKSGQGIAAVAPKRPNLMMKSIVHAVMAGVIAIYGLVVAVLVIGRIKRSDYDLAQAFGHLAAGLAVGVCGMASGGCIGILGHWGVRSTGLRAQMFMTSILMTGFAMVLGMYGLIIALLQAAK